MYKSLLCFCLVLLSSCCFAEYFYSKEVSGEYYEKAGEGGCLYRILVRDDAFGMSYGALCKTELKTGVSSRKFSKQLKKIVDYFDLSKELSEAKYVRINIGGKISHEPLIRAVNNDDSWPFNYPQHLAKRFADDLERSAEYRVQLSRIILSNEGYGAVVDMLSEIGVSVCLADDFVDPLYIISERAYSSKALFKMGVFEGNDAKKMYYPLIKGSVMFEIRKKKKKQLRGAE